MNLISFQLLEAAGRTDQEVEDILTSFFKSALVPLLSKVRRRVEELNEEVQIVTEEPQTVYTYAKFEEFVTAAIVHPQVCGFSTKPDSLF